MKECVFFNEIIFFIQYNLPQLEHTYSNDPPIIIYHLCNDFPEALQNTVPPAIASSFDEKRFLLLIQLE